MAKKRLSKSEEAVRAAVLVAQRQGGATVHSVAVIAGRKEEENHVFADLGRLVAAGHLRKDGNFYLVR